MEQHGCTPMHERHEQLLARLTAGLERFDATLQEVVESVRAIPALAGRLDQVCTKLEELRRFIDRLERRTDAVDATTRDNTLALGTLRTQLDEARRDIDAIWDWQRSHEETHAEERRAEAGRRWALTQMAVRPIVALVVGGGMALLMLGIVVSIWFKVRQLGILLPGSAGP